MTSGMYVVKRDGLTEPVAFDKITERLRKLCGGLNPEYVDPVKVTQRVVEGVYAGVTTTQIDSLAAETCAYMSQFHPDFSVLAARIAVSNLQKNTVAQFSEAAEQLYNMKDKSGRAASLISEELINVIRANKEVLDRSIEYSRDFDFDYFGFKTLEKSYLLRDPLSKQVIERPQQMFMRVALGIHGADIEKALETYNLMSTKQFIHATPTLFNAGTARPQMSSCFLLTMKADSIEGIYETLKQCAMISKTAGGIGVAISNIRASESYIRGTNGFSNGIVPMLRVFNDTARYVDQGGGKRKGSIAIYLEPWHADVFDFLDLKKNIGKEEQRARDLFYALWTPDLFMKRVMNNGDWTLFCPNEAPGLMDVYGTEFEKLYERYEAEGKGRKTVKAQALWFKILESQMETGTPYMLYKDACNEKSNQKNLGTIHCSNLCTEIVEFTNPDEVAVCNLASVNLSAFVESRAQGSESRQGSSENVSDKANAVDAAKTGILPEPTKLAEPIKQAMTSEGVKTFNHERLAAVVRVATRNLNKVIDKNYYPVPEARNSNMRHRPIGLGVQGFADALIMMRYPFESAEAAKLNKEIFETIYYAACEASCELAEQQGAYESFPGSPASEGKLQFDLWNVDEKEYLSGRYDWAALKERIKKSGLRNSLLVAPMPTASTAQILGNCESFEPYTQNIYTRRVLSGEFVSVNRHLIQDLMDRGIWSLEVKNKLIAHKGSVQKINEIPADLKELYKTVWEIKQRCLLELAAGRGPFIDQSQSLNIYMTDVTNAKLSSMHFYGWKLGLKTGQYYLRTKAAADAIQFTVEPVLAPARAPEAEEEEVCHACSA